MLSELPVISMLAGKAWWVQLGLATTVILVGLFIRYLYKGYISPLHNLPGPPAAHWLMGDYPSVVARSTGEVYAEMVDKYDRTFRYSQGFGLPPGLFTADIVSIAHMQRHPDLFIKPPGQTNILARLVGWGVLMTEGPTHRRHRRILNPAFAPGVIRDLMPVFLNKAYELKEKMASVIEEDVKNEACRVPAKPQDVVPGARKIDVGLFLTQVTFDIIGVAGMDYDFHCLHNLNPIVQSFREALTALTNMDFLALLQVLLPPVEVIPSKRTRIVDKSYVRLDAVGKELIERKRQELLISEGSIEKSTEIGKDILSLIVKANLAKDLPESQRLSDEEISAQVSTFIFAGSETSSNGMGWCLLRLAENPAIQTRLRRELFTLSAEPTLEELNALPFFENVLREALRLDPPVPETLRETTSDCMLPLSKPIVGKDGTVMDSIFLPKKTNIVEPIITVNRDPAIWGSDAEVFNPDRYDQAGYPAVHVPGSYGNLLTFNGGPRNCIGYRFALAEMKAVLFVLIRSFEFELLPSRPEITRKDFITMVPYVVGEEAEGCQLPLLVRPIE